MKTNSKTKGAKKNQNSVADLNSYVNNLQHAFAVEGVSLMGNTFNTDKLINNYAEFSEDLNTQTEKQNIDSKEQNNAQNSSQKSSETYNFDKVVNGYATMSNDVKEDKKSTEKQKKSTAKKSEQENSEMFFVPNFDTGKYYTPTASLFKDEHSEVSQDEEEKQQQDGKTEENLTEEKPEAETEESNDDYDDIVSNENEMKLEASLKEMKLKLDKYLSKFTEEQLEEARKTDYYKERLAYWKNYYAKLREEAKQKDVANNMSRKQALEEEQDKTERMGGSEKAKANNTGSGTNGDNGSNDGSANGSGDGSSNNGSNSQPGNNGNGGNNGSSGNNANSGAEGDNGSNDSDNGGSNGNGAEGSSDDSGSGNNDSNGADKTEGPSEGIAKNPEAEKVTSTEDTQNEQSDGSDGSNNDGAKKSTDENARENQNDKSDDGSNGSDNGSNGVDAEKTEDGIDKKPEEEKSQSPYKTPEQDDNNQSQQNNDKEKSEANDEPKTKEQKQNDDIARVDATREMIDEVIQENNEEKISNYVEKILLDSVLKTLKSERDFARLNAQEYLNKDSNVSKFVGHKFEEKFEIYSDILASFEGVYKKSYEEKKQVAIKRNKNLSQFEENPNTMSANDMFVEQLRTTYIGSLKEYFTNRIISEIDRQNLQDVQINKSFVNNTIKQIMLNAKEDLQLSNKKLIASNEDAFEIIEKRINGLRKTLKNSNVSKEIKTICKNDLAFLTNNTAYEKLNCRIVAEKNEKLLKKGSVDYFIRQVISVELSKIIANNNSDTLQDYKFDSYIANMMSDKIIATLDKSKEKFLDLQNNKNDVKTKTEKSENTETSTQVDAKKATESSDNNQNKAKSVATKNMDIEKYLKDKIRLLNDGLIILETNMAKNVQENDESQFTRFNKRFKSATQEIESCRRILKDGVESYLSCYSDDFVKNIKYCRGVDRVIEMSGASELYDSVKRLRVTKIKKDPIPHVFDNQELNKEMAIDVEIIADVASVIDSKDQDKLLKNYSKFLYCGVLNEKELSSMDKDLLQLKNNINDSRIKLHLLKEIQLHDKKWEKDLQLVKQNQLKSKDNSAFVESFANLLESTKDFQDEMIKEELNTLKENLMKLENFESELNKYATIYKSKFDEEIEKRQKEYNDKREM